MSRLVNAYTVHPDEIEPGDEMCFVVKAMVTYRDSDGAPHYRLYRCPWDGTIDDMPQGSRLGDGEAVVCQELFPSLAKVGESG